MDDEKPPVAVPESGQPQQPSKTKQARDLPLRDYSDSPAPGTTTEPRTYAQLAPRLQALTTTSFPSDYDPGYGPMQGSIYSRPTQLDPYQFNRLLQGDLQYQPDFHRSTPTSYSRPSTSYIRPCTSYSRPRIQDTNPRHKPSSKNPFLISRPGTFIPDLQTSGRSNPNHGSGLYVSPYQQLPSARGSSQQQRAPPTRLYGGGRGRFQARVSSNTFRGGHHYNHRQPRQVVAHRQTLDSPVTFNGPQRSKSRSEVPTEHRFAPDFETLAQYEDLDAPAGLPVVSETIPDRQGSPAVEFPPFRRRPTRDVSSVAVSHRKLNNILGIGGDYEEEPSPTSLRLVESAAASEKDRKDDTEDLQRDDTEDLRRDDDEDLAPVGIVVSPKKVLELDTRGRPAPIGEDLRIPAYPTVKYIWLAPMRGMIIAHNDTDKYDIPRRREESDETDFTSFLPDQKTYAEDNLPKHMGLIHVRPDAVKNVYIEDDKGRPVYNEWGHKLRYFPYLPIRISRDVEEWVIGYYLAMGADAHDLLDRMSPPPETPAGDREVDWNSEESVKYNYGRLRSKLSMRAKRWYKKQDLHFCYKNGKSGLDAVYIRDLHNEIFLPNKIHPLQLIMGVSWAMRYDSKERQWKMFRDKAEYYAPAPQELDESLCRALKMLRWRVPVEKDLGYLAQTYLKEVNPWMSNPDWIDMPLRVGDLDVRLANESFLEKKAKKDEEKKEAAKVLKAAKLEARKQLRMLQQPRKRGRPKKERHIKSEANQNPQEEPHPEQQASEPESEDEAMRRHQHPGDRRMDGIPSRPIFSHDFVPPRGNKRRGHEQSSNVSLACSYEHTSRVDPNSYEPQSMMREQYGSLAATENPYKRARMDLHEQRGQQVSTANAYYQASAFGHIPGSQAWEDGNDRWMHRSPYPF